MPKKFVFILGMVFSLNAHAIDWKEKDKQQHFSVSTGIATFTYGVTESAWASLGVYLGAGLAKELYDQQSYGKFSSQDVNYPALKDGACREYSASQVDQGKR